MVLQVIVFCVVAFGLLMLFARFIRIQSTGKQLKDLQQLFQAEGLMPPELTFGAAYDWDTFTITFANEHDLLLARERGVIDKFKQKLANYYKPDFNPDGAVFCTYVGQYRDWK